MGLLSSLARQARPAPALLHAAVLVLALALLVQPAGLSSETSVGEYSLKAAFIYNFSKFVDWPESAFRGKREFCIGALGRSPLDRELAKLAGRTVHGRSIVFRQLGSLDEAPHCQVLFISRSELVRFEAILETLRDHPVLTVAEGEEFGKRGGMISLEREGGKIVFDVNLREAQRSRLTPSSQLLKLARRIYGRP